MKARLAVFLRILACCCLPLAGAWLPLQAQTAPPVAEELIITAHRTGVPLRRLTVPVTVRTEADLRAQGNVALLDVLRQLPAMAASNAGGVGQTSVLRIRGEEGFRTLTLLDGIRLSDAGSPQVMPSFDHLLSSGIGRVEVLRGPQGLGYGADAGGVINLSSRRPSPGLQAGIDAQRGRFATRQWGADVGGGVGPLDFFLAAADLATAGFNSQTADRVLADADGYANTTVHGRVGLRLHERLQATLVQRRVSGRGDFDGCFDLQSGATLHDCRSAVQVESARAALDYSGAGVSHSISHAKTLHDRRTRYGGTEAFNGVGDLQRWEYLGSASGLPGFDLVFGADRELAKAGTALRRSNGVFAEYLSDFSTVWQFSAGLRHDNSSDFGSHLSHRFGLAKLLALPEGRVLKLRASAGSGFRAPSPYELAYNSSAAAFPPASRTVLQPETSRGHEVGIDYLGPGDLRVEAGFFEQRVADAISFDLAGYSGYLQDRGAGRVRGLELAVERTLFERLLLRANYTYNDARQPDGQSRLRRPRQLLNVAALWRSRDGRLRLSAFLRQSRTAMDQVAGQRLPLPDFTVLDATASYALGNQFELYGRLENALGTRYQEVTGYNTGGAAFFLGLRWRFAALSRE